MGFLQGEHAEAWERLRDASPASEADRDGMMIDVEQLHPPDLQVVSARDDGGTIHIELIWAGGREHPSLEELDVTMYVYIGVLGYGSTMISREVDTTQVRYLVATATEDGALGTSFTMVVGGERAEEMLARYHASRRMFGHS